MVTLMDHRMRIHKAVPQARPEHFHTQTFKIMLCWKQLSPSRSSCIGKDCNLPETNRSGIILRKYDDHDSVYPFDNLRSRARIFGAGADDPSHFGAGNEVLLPAG